jgi:hypothetical protein
MKTMDTIEKTLIRLAPGEYKMKTVVAEIGSTEPPYVVGRRVFRYNRMTLDGVKVEVRREGLSIFVSLQNVPEHAPPPAGASSETEGKP